MTDGAYPVTIFPFRFRRMDDHSVVAVSETGDHAFLANSELREMTDGRPPADLLRVAELKSKFLIGDPNSPGYMRLLASRMATKKETVTAGPSLYIIVPTLTCAHSCPYCQVSRSLDADGWTMSASDLALACDAVFETPSKTVTVEFQGGDPLIKYELVRSAVERIATANRDAKKQIRFVVASTLHQLSAEMCEFFRAHNVYLSTSIDGPAELHNSNRPTPSRDAFERTVRGIKLARELVGHDCVSALMTTTRASLADPEGIVDTYVDLGLHEIFLRPISPYGFAARAARRLAYPQSEFRTFYHRALDRVLYWNRRGFPIREVAAAIALNKILSPWDGGYVDLQSPTGAGLATLVYNYDGYVYPSDEARMFAETGDKSLRLGKIGQPLHELLQSQLQRELVRHSLRGANEECSACAYNPYCGPDPIAAHAQCGAMNAPPSTTRHCTNNIWLFDYLFAKLKAEDPWFCTLAKAWGRNATQRKEPANA